MGIETKDGYRGPEMGVKGFEWLRWVRIGWDGWGGGPATNLDDTGWY